MLFITSWGTRCGFSGCPSAACRYGAEAACLSHRHRNAKPSLPCSAASSRTSEPLLEPHVPVHVTPWLLSLFRAPKGESGLLGGALPHFPNRSMVCIAPYCSDWLGLLAAPVPRERAVCASSGRGGRRALDARPAGRVRAGWAPWALGTVVSWRSNSTLNFHMLLSPNLTVSSRGHQ